MIYVDVHEPKAIVNAIKKLGIPVFQVKLEVGDYSWNNIGIERKTSYDFFSSIFSRDPDNNLFSQLYQLKQYQVPILIIQGNLFSKWKYIGRKRVIIPDNEYNRRIKTAFTILSKLPIRYKVFHYVVPNQSSFVQLLKSLYLNTLDTKSYAPVKRKGATLEEIKENILTCVPGIGRKLAQKLVKDISSISDLCDMLQSDMYYPRIEELIGPKRAKKLQECLTK